MEQDVYAVVDIGSNSLRFMRGKRDRDGQWHFSKKELATTRLGKDVSRTGHLSREGIEASLEAMQQWNDMYPDLCMCRSDECRTGSVGRTGFSGGSTGPVWLALPHPQRTGRSIVQLPRGGRRCIARDDCGSPRYRRRQQ